MNALALVSLLKLAAALGERASLAVYPLQPASAEAAATAEALDATLRHQIASLDRFDVLARSQTEALLRPSPSVRRRPPKGRARANQGLGLNCADGAHPCLASFGRLSGASEVLFGTVAVDETALRQPPLWRVTLWLVDTGTEGEVRRAEVVGPPAEAGRAAAVAVLAPDLYVGRVVFAGAAERLRGSVRVDGVDRGPLAQEPLVLPVGTHLLALEGRDRTVEVRFGETTTVPLEIAAEPLAGAAAVGLPQGPGSGPALARSAGPAAPSGAANEATSMAMAPLRPERHPAHTWAFAVGGAGLAVAIGAVGFGLASQADRDAVDGRARPTPLPQQPALLHQAGEARDFGVAADVLFGAAALLGVTAVVLYLWDPGAEHSLAAGQREGSHGVALLQFP